MDNLKPCPFCNSDNLRVSKNFKNDGKLTMINCFVCCEDCGANGPTIVYVEDPIKAWNLQK